MTITDNQASRMVEAYKSAWERFGLTETDAELEYLDREAMKAAAQVLVPGWLPISEAPVDGTNILLARADGDFPIVAYAYSDGAFMCRREDDLLYPQPTHWMPLLSPPTPTEGEGR